MNRGVPIEQLDEKTRARILGDDYVPSQPSPRTKTKITEWNRDTVRSLSCSVLGNLSNLTVKQRREVLEHALRANSL